MSVISSDTEYLDLNVSAVSKVKPSIYEVKELADSKYPTPLRLRSGGAAVALEALLTGTLETVTRNRSTLQRWHEQGTAVTYMDLEEAVAGTIVGLDKPLRSSVPQRVALILQEKNGQTLTLRLNPTLGRWSRLCLPADYAANKLFPLWNQKKSLSFGNPWASGSQYTHSWAYNPGDVAQLLVNSGTSAYLRSLSTSYADDNVRVVGAAVRTLTANHFNWIHDKTNHKFSLELILDNDLEESAATAIYDDDETFWSASTGGSGALGSPTLTEELTVKAKGTSSLKIAVGAGTYLRSGAIHNYSPAQSWTGKEYLCLYLYGLNDGGEIRIYIYTGSGSNYRRYSLTDNWTGWRRHVIPFNNYSDAGGSWNLGNVTGIDILWNTAGTRYLDRTVVDIGQWIQVEAYVPDVAGGTQYNAYKIHAWSGSAYLQFLNWDDTAVGGSAFGSANFLNGLAMSNIYAAYYGFNVYTRGERTQTKTKLEAQGDAPNLTYSSYYGCKKRVGFAAKMPPDDGRDSSTYGISQAKLKLEVYYGKGADGFYGEATYEFADNNNDWYGLQLIDKAWLLLFHASQKRANFIILPAAADRPTLLELTADENEDLAKVKVGWSANKTSELKYGLDLTDPALDSDADGIPDLIENVEAYAGA